MSYEEEKELERKRQEELIELKKIKQGQLPNKYEKLQEEYEKEEERFLPKTPGQKLKYFFDYYKWHTLIILVVIASLTATVLWFCNKPSYDMQLVYASKEPISIIYSDVSELFEGYAKDYNGDGKVQVEINAINISGEGNGDNDFTRTNRGKLMATFTDNSQLVYILDETVYQYLHNTSTHDMFLDLSDLDDGVRNIPAPEPYQPGVNPGQTPLRDRISLEGTALGNRIYQAAQYALAASPEDEAGAKSLEGFLPEKLYVCVRNVSAAETDVRLAEKLEQQLALVAEMTQKEKTE